MSLINTALHIYTLITPTTVGAIAVTWATVFIAYRLYLHPLSNFPGPKIAAVSRWYEFYYDVIRGGAFAGHLPELHRNYGPIVRTAPNHVHVDDPEFFKEIFKSQTDFFKDPSFYQNVGIPESLLSILNPHKHRVRRNIISPLFSTQSMNKIMPLLQDYVERAAGILQKRYKEGKCTDIQNLYRCITVDVISMSLFGSTEDLLGQNENDIYPSILATLDIFSKNLWLLKHVPILAKIALNLPEKYSAILAPGYQGFRNHCQNWINMVKARREKGILQTEDGRTTVFDLLLEPNDEKSYQVPDMTGLVDEAFLFVIAGADSTAYTTACATYYILTHEEVLSKLKTELSGIPRLDNGRLDCKNIQSLPYLTCVVKESLRVASAIPGFLPRVVPPQGVTVQGKYIPGGSIVSSAIRTISYNAELFPEPDNFKPERWLGDEGKDLERWNVAFSKGPRACIGINLAYMEIYIILATFFADFDMSLHRTDAKSMEWRDYGVARNKFHVTVNARPLRV